jgi:hypothetical protein
MHLRGRVVGLLVALATLTGLSPANAALPSGKYEYTIRHPLFGQIGKHTAEFRQIGDDLVVLTSIRLTVGLSLMPIYTFESEGREVWRDGQLVSASAVTNDNGTELRVTAQREGDRLVVDGPKGHLEASGTIGTTTFWNAGTMTAPLFWEPTTGLFYKVGITPHGAETVESAVRTFPTRRFAMTGEIKGELWYAEDDTWVRMDFEKYGSTLTVMLESIRRPVEAAR